MKTLNKQQFDKLYVGEKKVVQCKTPDDAYEFLGMAHSFGYSGRGGWSYAENTHWNTYKENTRYNLFKGMYGDSSHRGYPNNKFEVIEFKKGGITMNKKETYTKQMMDKMGVDRVLYNGAATIVWLTDGRKGVSVQSIDDHQDRNVGFAMAYAYAVATDGNKSQFKKNVAKMEKHKGYKK